MPQVCPSGLQELAGGWSLCAGPSRNDRGGAAYNLRDQSAPDDTLESIHCEGPSARQFQGPFPAFVPM
ncbi:hypothetical protein GCM10010840_29690 [Deinococcus aerolatus]|uniref:Uncharacterized protein n=1 Tax=Deinococcus aerolatus TaxID=522487 RepID=A0ABQ2GEJ4_9DEIO|nr:hypothetical protein GCM10010840_29690 [Deinococcus aerolatus]